MYYISIALRGVWLPYRRQLCFHFAISPKHNSSAIRKISYASIPHIWETRQPLRIGRSPEIRSIRVRRFWIMKKEMSEHLKRQWQKVRGEFGATEQTEKLREIPPKKTGIDVRKCKSAQIELRARACKTTFPITKPGTRLLESHFCDRNDVIDAIGKRKCNFSVFDCSICRHSMRCQTQTCPLSVIAWWFHVSPLPLRHSVNASRKWCRIEAWAIPDRNAIWIGRSRARSERATSNSLSNATCIEHEQISNHLRLAIRPHYNAFHFIFFPSLFRATIESAAMCANARSRCARYSN